MNRQTIIGKKAVIFDMDGTIIDTLHIWDNVDVKFLAKRGVSVPPDYFKSLAAMTYKEAARYTIELFSLNEEPEDIMEEWTLLADEEYENNAKLFPYVREYLDELKDNGIKIALATGSTKRFYEKALSSNGILELFDALCSVDEAGCGKSRPDVYYLAMKKLSVEPCECVIFEDIPSVAQTAALTGAQVFLVHSDGRFSDSATADVQKNIKIIKTFKDAPKILN